jgi:hypothetical protein
MTVTTSRTGVAAVAALLIGLVPPCSAGSPRPDGAPNAVVIPRSTAAPQATVEDFAAVVAEHHAEWDDQVETTESDCLDPALTFACGAGYLTLGMQGDIIQLSLSALHKSGTAAYIGEPPEEIEDLVAETEDAGAAVGDAADELDAAGCADPMASDCTTQLIALESAIDELTGKLDAWAVYS